MGMCSAAFQQTRQGQWSAVVGMSRQATTVAQQARSRKSACNPLPGSTTTHTCVLAAAGAGAGCCMLQGELKMSHWHWDAQDRQTLAITGLFSIQAVR